MKLIKGLTRDNKQCRDDIEQLRKLFIMPDSPDKFVEFGRELLDMIHSFFKEKGGIHSAIPLTELEKLFSNVRIPREPQLLKNVLLEIKNNIVAHSVKVGNPYYIGHMTSAVPYFMILLEMIVSALNQNQVKIESAKASTFVERELIAWMHRLVYDRSDKFYRSSMQNPEVSLGNITIDGTLANLTAMLVARNRQFRPDGRFPGVRRAGMGEALQHYGYRKAVILVSKRGHYSINKVARIIGLGDDNVIKVPVDARNRVDIAELERICADIHSHNKGSLDRIKIMAIVGIAGTTETGNIDNLREIARIASNYGAYFHVDAAWGGAVLMVEELRYLFSGIESADSVSIDSHKLLYSPVSMGMVLFRNEKDMEHLKHYSNYIIRQDSVDQGRFTVEGSRPFSALKPWATFKILGSQGFRLIFEHAFEITSVLRGLVEVHRNFEPMNQPELFIFNYRFVPKEIQEKIESIIIRIGKCRDQNDRHRQRGIARLHHINTHLNELNTELHKAIREEDESFVSRTMFDSPQYFYQDIVVLRAITINPLTTPDILKEILEEQNRLGSKIYRSEFASRLDKI